MTGTTWKRRRGLLLVNGSLGLLVLVWMIPVIGLLVSSFRDRFSIQTSGWWTIFPHQAWVLAEEINPRDAGLIVDEDNRVIEVEGTRATFAELREGVALSTKSLGRATSASWSWLVW